MPNCTKHLYLIVFADDTNIFLLIVLSTYLMLVENINSELVYLSVWLCMANKLSLNIDKINFKLLGNKGELGNYLPTSIDWFNISQWSTCTLIGSIIDEQLTWAHHITNKYLSIIFEDIVSM